MPNLLDQGPLRLRPLGCLLSPTGRGVTALAFSCLKNVKVTTSTRKERTSRMSKKKQGGPEEAVDKAVGRLAEATGRVTGDKSLGLRGGRRGGRAS
jgi:hypothetical protein